MKKLLVCAMAAMSLSAASVSAADHGEHDAVRDYQGDVIKNTWNNCVVTKWKSGEYGCDEQNQLSSELLNVYFNFDSDVLTPAAKEKLDKVVGILENAKNVNSVDIVGYADQLGNYNYNKRLSNRRAKAVRSYIESRGYFNTRNVEVVGLGSGQPVTNCGGLVGHSLKACLWRDRRVEIQLNYEQ